MEKETKQILFYLGVIVIFLALLSIFVPRQAVVKTEANNNTSKELPDFSYIPTIFMKSEESTSVSLKVPAVDSEGNGAAALIIVEAVKGNGKTLVDIDGLLFLADTQQSIRMARLIAGNISGKNLSEYDLIYSVEADASIIGGPSAGAAITTATIFALNGEKPRENVMITGTINHDGTIGPVDSILEKAKVAKASGSSILLVPLLQSKEIVYDTNNYCHTFGTSEVCTEERVPREVDIAKETGVAVAEVQNIEQALEYFKP